MLQFSRIATLVSSSTLQIPPLIILLKIYLLFKKILHGERKTILIIFKLSKPKILYTENFSQVPTEIRKKKQKIDEAIFGKTL